MVGKVGELMFRLVVGLGAPQVQAGCWFRPACYVEDVPLHPEPCRWLALDGEQEGLPPVKRLELFPRAGWQVRMMAMVLVKPLERFPLTEGGQVWWLGVVLSRPAVV